MQTRRRAWKFELRLVLASVLVLGAAVFVPVGSAEAKFKVLHRFGVAGDGEDPSGLVRKGRDLYGTTYGGGAGGHGTVFKLAADGTETVLHSFTGSDGSIPAGGVVVDKNGNLYGTTEYGGTYDNGTVFKLTPGGILTVLYSFGGGSDGTNPVAKPIADKTSSLYGTTSFGGAFNLGTIFKLAPDGTETILHSFDGSDGSYPGTGLISDDAENLYGTTGSGGSAGQGAVFKLSPEGGLTVLHSFGGGSDGSYPYADLITDKAGNLYGATLFGGGGKRCRYDCGTIFEIAPDGTKTTLYTFQGEGDGAYPVSLTADYVGNLYGSTDKGGVYDRGTVYELTASGIHTVLHSFEPRKARHPRDVAIDRKGNIYGTTRQGGTNDAGTLFSLRP